MSKVASMEESNKASSPDKAGLSRAMKTAIAAAGLAALVICGVLFGVLFATGVLGSDGSNGSNGSFATGVLGSNGNNGSNGSNGSFATGVIGSNGSNGSNGSDGSDGSSSACNVTVLDNDLAVKDVATVKSVTTANDGSIESCAAALAAGMCNSSNDGIKKPTNYACPQTCSTPYEAPSYCMDQEELAGLFAGTIGATNRSHTCATIAPYCNSNKFAFLVCPETCHSTSVCGFDISFDDKTGVCVEVPPKIVESSRRLGSLQGRRTSEVGPTADSPGAPTSEEQSMKFYCREGSSKAQCEDKCNADMIYVKQVFLLEDDEEDAFRENWVGSHVQVVINEIPQTFAMDYSRGCSDKADYLAQDFSDRTNFNCGLSEIGFDLYSKIFAGETCPSDDTIQEDGTTYCYAGMNNLVFGTFLQNTLKQVQSGALSPGIHTQGFAKEYNHIVDLCVAEFKVNLVIPLSEARNTSV